MGCHRFHTKTQVEDCLGFDLAYLRKWGSLVPGVAMRGSYQWSVRGQVRNEVAYVADLTDDTRPVLRLEYVAGGESVKYAIELEATVPTFGGLRWWFRCPLSVAGRACRRRVRVLYSRGRYFGCRHCQDLTYRSTQEWDSRVAAMAKNPALIDAILGGGVGGKGVLLALRAGSKRLEMLRDELDALEEGEVKNRRNR